MTGFAGKGKTVTVFDILLQPVAVNVNVKVTLPAKTPVAKPLLSIVAMPGALLIQVPPVPGLAVMVAPAHNKADGVLTIGGALTVMVDVVLL